MKSKRFRSEVVQDDHTAGCGIRLPFEPKTFFGKARMPVVARIGGHEYRTTTFTMHGEYWVPLNKVNRAAAGVEAGATLTVTLTADESPRVVEVPEDLGVVEAKKPETRARRVEKTLKMLKGS